MNATVKAGRREGFSHIAVITAQPLMGLVISRYPEIAERQHVVITSLDSGAMTIGPDEDARGWRYEGALAISPRITNIEEVPLGEYDEWLVYSEDPPSLSQVEVFVNYRCLLFDESVPSSAVRDIQERFWRQMQRLSPTCYISEGGAFHLASQNHELVSRICEFVSSRSAD